MKTPRLLSIVPVPEVTLSCATTGFLLLHRIFGQSSLLINPCWRKVQCLPLIICRWLNIHCFLLIQCLSTLLHYYDVLQRFTLLNFLFVYTFTFVMLNRRSSEIQGTALGKCLRAWTCIYRSVPAGVAQSRHAFVGGTVSTWARWRIPVNKGRRGIRNADQALTVRGGHADRIAGSPSW